MFSSSRIAQCGYARAHVTYYKTSMPIAWRRRRLTTKMGTRLFYKGFGSGPTGAHTPDGKYMNEARKIRQFIIPELANFQLKPYVSHQVALPEPLEDPRVGPILPSHFFEATTTQAGPPRHVTEATVSHLSSMKKSPLLLKLFNEMTKYYPDVIGGSRYGEPIARFLKPIAHCRSLQL